MANLIFPDFFQETSPEPKDRGMAKNLKCLLLRAGFSILWSARLRNGVPHFLALLFLLNATHEPHSILAFRITCNRITVIYKT